MPIAGRTNGQHALPATFGFKVAVWIDELLRHTERLGQAAPRLFVAMLGGGGAGTYASLGKMGLPVQAGIGRLLGFGEFIIESAGSDQALQTVDHIPYPEQLYLEICGLIFPNGEQASPDEPDSGDD